MYKITFEPLLSAVRLLSIIWMRLLCSTWQDRVSSVSSKLLWMKHWLALLLHECAVCEQTKHVVPHHFLLFLHYAMEQLNWPVALTLCRLVVQHSVIAAAASSCISPSLCSLQVGETQQSAFHPLSGTFNPTGWAHCYTWVRDQQTLATVLPC